MAAAAKRAYRRLQPTAAQAEETASRSILAYYCAGAASALRAAAACWRRVLRNSAGCRLTVLLPLRTACGPAGVTESKLRGSAGDDLKTTMSRQRRYGRRRGGEKPWRSANLSYKHCWARVKPHLLIVELFAGFGHGVLSKKPPRLL